MKTFAPDYQFIEQADKAMMLQQHGLIIQLNPLLAYYDYAAMIDEMCQLNYRMLCVFDRQRCIAVSGYWIATKIYCGKYLEADNVVVDKAYRSKGIGQLICNRLTEIAQKNNCRVMMLDAYLSNEAAHRFYERDGYVKKGYHFVKPVVQI